MNKLKNTMDDLSEAHRIDDFPSADRDEALLTLIGEEELTGFTFEGLRRRMRAHAETLSRALDRLERQKILIKENRGYTVTERGREIAGTRKTGRYGSRLVLLKTLLPPAPDNRVVASNLMGRWFGTLRWLGYSEDGETTTMKWITEGGEMQVEAAFSGKQLTISGLQIHGGSFSGAITAAHRLVGFISKYYGPDRTDDASYLNPGTELTDN